MARRLGWASLGLGVASLAAPQRLAWLTGTEQSPASPMIISAIGLRELAQAAALLSAKRPGRWVWSRVAGDAIDLALLGTAARSAGGPRRTRAIAAATAVAGITAIDLYTALKANRVGEKAVRGGKAHVSAAITINKPLGEVYRAWRDLESWPRFMAHLQSVQVNGARHSHWTANAPGMRSIEWDAEIVEDSPDRLIAWRSMPGALVANWGRVEFSPGPRGRGTEVRVEMDYTPPGGSVGVVAARLFGEEPKQQVTDDLRRFKQLVETGEVVRSEGAPQGLKLRRPGKERPAQPIPADQLVHG